MVQTLWGFKDFSLASGRPLAIVNGANSAQNLPISTQRRNFKIPPKIEIFVYFRNKNFYV
jgi:hypothetical protein